MHEKLRDDVPSKSEWRLSNITVRNLPLPKLAAVGRCLNEPSCV